MSKLNPTSIIKNLMKLSDDAFEIFVLALDSVNQTDSAIYLEHTTESPKDSAEYFNRDVLNELVEKDLVYRLPSSNDEASFVSVKQEVIRSAKNSGMFDIKILGS